MCVCGGGGGGGIIDASVGCGFLKKWGQPPKPLAHEFDRKDADDSKATASRVWPNCEVPLKYDQKLHKW